MKKSEFALTLATALALPLILILVQVALMAQSPTHGNVYPYPPRFGVVSAYEPENE